MPGRIDVISRQTSSRKAVGDHVYGTRDVIPDGATILVRTTPTASRTDLRPMPTTPAERLDSLVEHVRLGWQLVQENPAFREQARGWLASHPSDWREIDELWEECLRGEGVLAAWLTSGNEPSAWRGSPSLHSILASHPFPDLLSWSIRTRSRAS